MNEPHNKGATSASPNDLNGDGYEHRDIRPASHGEREDGNPAENPAPVRAERAVVLSFRSADLADTPPPDAMRTAVVGFRGAGLTAGATATQPPAPPSFR